MSDPLKTYLDDHLAGASFAIDLVEELRDRHIGLPLGSWAAHLLAEIQADHKTLETFVESLGATGTLKKASAWLTEKVSRFKLHGGGDGLGTFEALEFLALGIQGKLALWRTLMAIQPSDPRIVNLDLPTLMRRAEDQYAQAEKQRLQAAEKAFVPSQADLSDTKLTAAQ